MKALIIFIVIFVMIINVYTFLKYKKKKKKNTSVADIYRNAYLKRKMAQSKASPNPGNYTRYTTKYNSTVDYIDKDEFFKEAASAANPSSMQQGSGYAAGKKHNGLHNNFM